jgi:phage-related protein
MERLLADAEKLTGKKYDISNLSDVYEAIHVIQGELGITGTTANEAATTVSGSFNMLKSSWTDLLGNLALGQDVGAYLTNVITSAGTFMANLIPMVVNVITSIPTAIMEAIPSLLPALQDMGAQIISNIAGGTEMNIGEMLDKGIEVITGFTNSIFENLPQLITTAGTMISTLAGAIMTNLPTILEKGVLLIAKIAEGFIQNLPAIVSAIVQMFANITSTIITHLPEMLAKGIELIGKLVAGIIRAIPEIRRAMGQIIDNAKSALKNVDWAQVGKDIINGIIAGIKAMGSALAGALKDIVTAGLDVAKEALGIASPSKVFRDEVGKWIPAGVAVGIQANTKDVTGAIEDMKAQAINASQMQISTTYSEEAIREREERMDAIVGLLATYLPECATPTVIDGESMMETINTQLGLGVI